MCLPSTCHPKDVQNAINRVIYPILHLPIQIGLDCDYHGKLIKLNTAQIVVM